MAAPRAGPSLSVSSLARELRAGALLVSTSCGIPTNSPDILFVSMVLKGANAHIIILKVRNVAL